MRMEELKLKLINETEKQKQIIHPSFRLWLSLKGRPATEFPLELLRHSIKIAVEQSQTLQMNMLRLYQKMPASVLQIQSHHNLDSFKRLLFGLSFMHSSLVSRSKFQTFMNVNIARVKDDQGSLEDNDFEVASAILKLFTSKYERIPWWALKYMLELQYANHSLAITELRVVTTYLNKIFCEEALSNQDFKFSSTAPNLIMPPTGISSLRNGDLSSYHNFITSNYPSSDDDPEIYGLDPYVGVARNVHQAHRIFHPFQQLLMRNIKLEKMKQQQEQVVQNECVATAEQVQAQQSSSQKQNSQGRANLMMRMVLVDDELDKTLTKIAFILKQLPKPVDESPLKKKMHENLKPCDQPLYYVLLLELRQYENLVKTVTSLLQILNEAIQGHDHAMTDEMSLLFDCVNKNIVPEWWQKDYSNTNDLGCWLKDLKVRVNQINCLALSPTLPTTVWLGGFIYPKAFLTAVLQRAARECGKPISQLCWNFKISNERDELNSKTASEGICVEGMYLLGANWDTENAYLKESLPFDYSVEMPPVQLIPVETIEKIHSDIYEAPCYKDCSPINNSSLVCWIDLNPGKDTIDNWILRNVTVLLINPAK
ncbi:unnamed protein product [Orchesella dallaii]|uniref:Uncharacterized protein n=1 Tax=Orchesella dallaii TaxID=48710 RepID=A0ABP1QSK7_9HEXA